jgi:hypothetical protein
MPRDEVDQTAVGDLHSWVFREPSVDHRRAFPWSQTLSVIVFPVECMAVAIGRSQAPCARYEHPLRRQNPHAAVLDMNARRSIG